MSRIFSFLPQNCYRWVQIFVSTLFYLDSFIKKCRQKSQNHRKMCSFELNFDRIEKSILKLVENSNFQCVHSIKMVWGIFGGKKEEEKYLCTYIFSFFFHDEKKQHFLFWFFFKLLIFTKKDRVPLKPISDRKCAFFPSDLYSSSKFIKENIFLVNSHFMEIYTLWPPNLHLILQCIIYIYIQSRSIRLILFGFGKDSFLGFKISYNRGIYHF